jgi:putative transposase
MDASRDDVLTYMHFPREHWPQIASTNPLERVNREIKRRADVVGTFPDDDAIVRLLESLPIKLVHILRVGDTGRIPVG